MSRVVVISNRVMLPKEKKPEAAGGLAVALFDTLQETNGLWFGWSGRVTTNEDVLPNVQKDEGITYAIVDLTKKDYEKLITFSGKNVLIENRTSAVVQSKSISRV